MRVIFLAALMCTACGNGDVGQDAGGGAAVGVEAAPDAKAESSPPKRVYKSFSPLTQKPDIVPEPKGVQLNDTELRALLLGMTMEHSGELMPGQKRPTGPQTRNIRHGVEAFYDNQNWSINRQYRPEMGNWSIANNQYCVFNIDYIYGRCSKIYKVGSMYIIRHLYNDGIVKQYPVKLSKVK